MNLLVEDAITDPRDGCDLWSLIQVFNSMATRLFHLPMFRPHSREQEGQRHNADHRQKAYSDGSSRLSGFTRYPYLTATLQLSFYDTHLAGKLSANHCPYSIYPVRPSAISYSQRYRSKSNYLLSLGRSMIRGMQFTPL